MELFRQDTLRSFQGARKSTPCGDLRGETQRLSFPSHTELGPPLMPAGSPSDTPRSGVDVAVTWRRQRPSAVLSQPLYQYLQEEPGEQQVPGPVCKARGVRGVFLLPADSMAEIPLQHTSSEFCPSIAALSLQHRLCFKSHLLALNLQNSWLFGTLRTRCYLVNSMNRCLFHSHNKRIIRVTT